MKYGFICLHFAIKYYSQIATRRSWFHTALAVLSKHQQTKTRKEQQCYGMDENARYGSDETGFSSRMRTPARESDWAPTRHISGARDMPRLQSGMSSMYTECQQVKMTLKGKHRDYNSGFCSAYRMGVHYRSYRRVHAEISHWEQSPDYEPHRQHYRPCAHFRSEHYPDWHHRHHHCDYSHCECQWEQWTQ